MDTKLKYKNYFDKFVILFLYLQPFIDVITSLQIRNSDVVLSISSIVRGLFLIIVFIWLYKNNKDKKLLIILFLYFILYVGHTITLTTNNIYTEISNMFQIFYLPILILFFSYYDNKLVDDKFITKIYLIYLNLIVIPYLLGIGFNITEVYSEKMGYLGLFYGGNEISAIIIGISPIVLKYVNNSKNYILKIILYIELFMCVILIGTKTLLLGIIIVLLYCLVKYLKNNYINLKKIYKMLVFIIPLVVILSMIIVLPSTPVYKNILVTLNYFDININNIFTYDSINNLVFSNRLSFLKNINDIYVNSNLDSILYGLGKSTITNIKTIEIDIFDIFYSIGIYGICIWILLMTNSIKKEKLRREYKFSLILFILMSLFSGHVLVSTVVSIYIALLFILNKNDLKIDKENVLIISDDNKNYDNNNYYIDKVLSNKKITIIIDLLFNNYDYICFTDNISLFKIKLLKIFIRNTKILIILTNKTKITKNLKYVDIIIVNSKKEEKDILKKANKTKVYYNKEKKNFNIFDYIKEQSK